MTDHKNLILAVVLSIVILVGWQFLFPPDIPPRDESIGDISGEVVDPGLPVTPGADMAFPGEAGSVDRAQVLDGGGRIPIDTAHAVGDRMRGLHGSISLQGGRLDDLTLVGYHETVDPASPEIVLLSPRGSLDPYFAEVGWAADGGVLVPDSETIWSTSSQRMRAHDPVVLTWDNGEGLTFERIYTLDDDYLFTVTQRVINTGTQSAVLRPFSRIGRFYRPDTLGFFILHEGPYGVFDETLEEFSYGELEDDQLITRETTGGWLGFTDKYWLVALIPDQSEPVETRFAYQNVGTQDRYFADVARDPLTVIPGQSIEVTSHIFAGAKEVQLVDIYQEQLGITRFDLTIDWGWFWFLTKPIFVALSYIQSVVGNFGVAILVLTLLIKLLFFPLANKSYKAMSKMKALQPEMMQIRERFQEDRQKMNMEMMALYRREKANPASGCLPILVQIPVFFALYKVLFVTIEMRHTPFFGWIQDLSAPDPTSILNLFGLLPFNPPAALTFVSIGIWPILMGITMFLQQKLNPAPADKMQARIFMALPIVFTFMLAQFPAGLVIYWTWNNLLSIAQQYAIMRRHGVRIGGGVDPKPAATLPPGPAGTGEAASETAEEAEDGKTKRRQKPAAANADSAPAGESDEAGPTQPVTPPRPRSRGGSAKRRSGGSQRGKRKR